MNDVAAQLSTAFEELRAAEDELRRRNSALIQAQFELEAERQRYLELFDFVPIAYVVTDEFGVVEQVNAAAEELLGADAKRLAGKPLVGFIPPPERHHLRRLLVEISQDGTVHELEVGLTPRTTEAIIVHARVRAVPREGRREFWWSLENVTERRQNEIELRLLAAELEGRVAVRAEELVTERARLAGLVEQIPAGIVMLNARTNEVLVANEAAERMLGGLDISGREGYREDGSRYGPDDWPLARSLRSDERVDAERAVLVLPGGEQVVLEISSAPVRDASGHTVAAVSVFQDVTARERREAAEREFVTNAAHELRTPLAAITSAIELLQSGAKDELEARERFLGHIEREAQRLQGLVRALLTLARAQTATEAPKLEIVPISAILEEVVATLEPQARVPVDVHCPPDLAALANRDLLERVLTNLVGNAAQYTAEGWIVVAAASEGDAVELTVTDTGVGVAAAAQARIFDRFFRASRDREGFGLGLAIASEAVRAMGGAIEIEPREGGGTIARVRLRGATVLAG